MYIADTLSRAYIPGNLSVHAVTFVEIDITEGLSVSPMRLQELRDDTACDCMCSAETHTDYTRRVAFAEVRH